MVCVLTSCDAGLCMTCLEQPCRAPVPPHRDQRIAAMLCNARPHYNVREFDNHFRAHVDHLRLACRDPSSVERVVSIAASASRAHYYGDGDVGVGDGDEHTSPTQSSSRDSGAPRGTSVGSRGGALSERIAREPVRPSHGAGSLSGACHSQSAAVIFA